MTDTLSVDAPDATGQSASPRPNRSLYPPITAQRLILAAVVVGLVAGTVWALFRVGVNPLTLILEREDIFNLLERMWPPRIEEPRLVWEAALETFLMAFAGTALGVLLAIPVAILSANNITRNPVIRGVARAIIVITRALPELILALIFVRVYSIGVLPGVLALGVHSVGMLGKLFSDAIEQIEPGPREGVQATGAGRTQEFVSGVWPQILPSIIAVSLYRLDINFRASTILGLVGAGGIGLQIRAHQGSLDYPQLLGVTLVIIVMILAVEVVSTSIRSMILGHTERRGSRLDAWLRRTPDRSVFAPEPSKAAKEAFNRETLRPPWTGERVTMTLFGLGSAVLLVLAFWIPDMSFIEMVRGLPEIPATFWRLVPLTFDGIVPRLDVADDWNPDYWGDILDTVAMGFAATGISLLFALPTALLAARNVAPARWVYQIARLFILLVRALPDLIVAVIFVAALGLGPKPGVLALAIGLYGFADQVVRRRHRGDQRGSPRRRPGHRRLRGAGGGDVGPAPGHALHRRQQPVPARRVDPVVSRAGDRGRRRHRLRAGPGQPAVQVRTGRLPAAHHLLHRLRHRAPGGVDTQAVDLTATRMRRRGDVSPRRPGSAPTNLPPAPEGIGGTERGFPMVDERVLSGIRVCEMSIAVAAPSAGRYLAYHGAEVIKIESRVAPDVARLFGSAWARDDELADVFYDTSPYLPEMSGGKKSVGLEVKDPDALAALRAVIATCDVFLSNLTADALARLGLSATELRAADPRLIHVAMPGFGVDPSLPYHHFRAFGPNQAPLVGFDALTGEAGEEPAGIATIAPPDYIGGMHALMGILTALEQRDTTGDGSTIVVSQMETTVSLLGPFLLDHGPDRAHTGAGREPAAVGGPGRHLPLYRP